MESGFEPGSARLHGPSTLGSVAAPSLECQWALVQWKLSRLSPMAPSGRAGPLRSIKPALGKGCLKSPKLKGSCSQETFPSSPGRLTNHSSRLWEYFCLKNRGHLSRAFPAPLCHEHTDKSDRLVAFCISQQEAPLPPA